MTSVNDWAGTGNMPMLPSYYSRCVRFVRLADGEGASALTRL